MQEPTDTRGRETPAQPSNLSPDFSFSLRSFSAGAPEYPFLKESKNLLKQYNERNGILNSIKPTARISGLLYLLSAPLSVFSIIYLPSVLIVPGDAARTIQNIISSESLFRLGIVSFFIGQMVYIILPLLFYKLFAPVNKIFAVLMVVLIYLSLPISFTNELNNLAVLRLINSDSIDQNQLQFQVMQFLNLRQDGIVISGIFWGLWLFPLGFLVFKSDYYPKILGILLLIACFGYVFDSFSHILFPGFTFKIAACTFVGEISFMLWLIFRGINVSQWEKRSTGHE